MEERKVKYHNKRKFYYDRISFASDRVEVSKGKFVDMKWKYYWYFNHIMAMARVK